MAQQNADLKSLWEEAVREYFSKTQQKPEAQKWTQSMTTQADLNDLIGQQEAEFSQFRSSHKKFWSVLRETMGQLQNIGGIAQAALQFSPFAPAAVIVQAGLGLVRAGAAVSETYDDLETLFRTVRDITDRVDEYLQGPIDDKIHRVLIRLLTSLLDAFGEGAATVQRGRGKELIRRVLKREDKIKSALQRVQELERTEIALVAATTRSTTQRTEKNINDERHRILLREKLCADAAADNEKFGKDIESSRLSQSGAWVLEEELYKQWYTMKFPVLWVLGQPGAGKTYLASRIISEIRGKSHLMSYFYMRESMNTQHTLEVLIKVISYQITRLQDAYRQRITQYCSGDDGESISGMTWEELFTKLLVEPLSDDVAKPVFVVIDGVDEATSTEQELIVKLTRKLSDLQNTSHRQPKLQLLLLARPELQYNISNTWQGGRRLPKMLRIEPAMSKSDIENFVRKRVEKDVHLLRKLQPKQSKTLKKHIVKTISNSSDGMFLLAKLMLTELENINKVALVRETLTKPPKGLGDMFQRVIVRLDMIGGFDKQDLNELIMWVACAKRDLLLGELDLVLNLRDVLDNGISALEEELRTRFGSFFTIVSTEIDRNGGKLEIENAASGTGSEAEPDNSSGMTSEGEEKCKESSEDEGDIDSDGSSSCEFEEDVPPNYFTATVKFSHASVGQHFRRVPLHRGIGMDLNFAQAHIALTCSQFLADNLRDGHSKPWREPDLMKYSVDHFLDHFEEVDFKQLKLCHPDIYISLSKAVASLFRDRDSIAIQQSHTVAAARLSSWSFYPWQMNHDVLGIEHFNGQTIPEHDAEDCKPWTLSSNRHFELIAQTIPPEEIRAMASLSDMKKDALFHRVLGSNLAKINTQQHLQSALEEFELSIQLAEDTTCVCETHLDKAKILFALGMFDEAIKFASFALKSLPEDGCHENVKRALLELMSDANLRVGNQERALKMARDLQRSNPYFAKEAYRLIVIAHHAGNYTETTNFLRSAYETYDGACLLGRVMTYHTPQRSSIEYMSIACKEMGELDLARKAFQSVRKQAWLWKDTEEIAAADGAIAQLNYGFYREDETAIALWESIIREFPSTIPAFEASFFLMPWYFSKAQNADPIEITLWESKMERLGDVIESMTPTANLYPTHYEVPALLAKWYTTQGKMEKARATIRPFIDHCMGEITNQGSSNDYYAYTHLSRALLCVGDRQNAAISSAFTKPLHNSQKLLEKAWRTTSNGGTTDNFFGRCDGACGRTEASFKSWNVCEICVDIAFCDECLPKVRAGAAQFRVCDPKHPHLEIYPPKGLVTKGPEGYRVHLDDGREVSDDEWLAMISHEWL
ncbi:hypothetical protein E8E13_006435 [Curvularia kusanoi]|uniref:NACHT domain-containing protein n=1 Tax=Curvularia kusanoi TaxID=90978 RepID=A0A9P4TJD7_CURKU|nr:hypothetical protein E8E13_006435 [Curvularia kusanoi]